MTVNTGILCYSSRLAFMFCWIFFCFKKPSIKSIGRKEMGYGNSTNKNVALYYNYCEYIDRLWRTDAKLGWDFSHLHLFQGADTNGRMWHESDLPVTIGYNTTQSPTSASGPLPCLCEIKRCSGWWRLHFDVSWKVHISGYLWTTETFPKVRLKK